MLMVHKRQQNQNHHFRELPSLWYETPRLTAEFVAFANAEILPLVTLTGYKLDQKKVIATHVLNNLITAGLVGKCIRDSRNTHQRNIEFRVHIWDAIIKAGLADVCKGSEQSGRQTLYRATSKLLDLRKEWTLQLLLDVALARNSNMDDATLFALVVLHAGKRDLATGRLLPKNQRKKPISVVDQIKKNASRTRDGKPDPEAINRDLARLREIEDHIEFINNSNLAHNWKAFVVDSETGQKYVFQPNVCLRQIHVGQLFRAAGLYSWGPLSGQNLSKEQRRSLLIDGEQAAELDFSGMVTRMLYHYHPRIAPKGDVYRPDKIMPKFYDLENGNDKKAIVRAFVKQITNICWNVLNRSQAHSAIGNLLANHEHRDFLKTVVYQIEETNPTDLVDRLLAAHPDLHSQFFTQIGLELMTKEGEIMLHILYECAKHGKPVLGIHDSVVCRDSDADFVRNIMTDAYRQFLTFRPVIKRSF